MSIPLCIRQTALLLSMEMQNKSVYNESSIRQETIIRRDESHEKDGRKTTDRHPEISAGQRKSYRKGSFCPLAGDSGDDPQGSYLSGGEGVSVSHPRRSRPSQFQHRHSDLDSLKREDRAEKTALQQSDRPDPR